MDERAIKAAEDFIDNHSSAIRLWKEDQRRSVAKIMAEFAERHYRATQTAKSTPPTEQLLRRIWEEWEYFDRTKSLAWNPAIGLFDAVKAWAGAAQTRPEETCLCPKVNNLRDVNCPIHGDGRHSPAPAPQPKWERLESCPECDGDGCNMCEPAPQKDELKQRESINERLKGRKPLPDADPPGVPHFPEDYALAPQGSRTAKGIEIAAEQAFNNIVSVPTPQKPIGDVMRRDEQRRAPNHASPCVGPLPGKLDDLWRLPQKES
jgi:hypothetical protein